MTRTTQALAGLLALTVTGCANLNSTEQRMLSGGAIGAGGGALLGAVTGGLSIAGGALIGAGAGAAAGYIIDQTSR